MSQNSVLENLRAQEAELLKRIKEKSSEKNEFLQTNRQVLINAAHFLRIYHQSGTEISQILEANSISKAFCVEIADIKPGEEQNVLDPETFLAKNGLRIVNDYFDDGHFFRASAALKYLEENGFIRTDSLNYFSDRFSKIIFDHLSLEIVDSAAFIQSIIPAFAILKAEFSFNDLRCLFPNINNAILKHISIFYQNVQQFNASNFDGQLPIFDDDSDCPNLSLINVSLPTRDYFADWINKAKTQIKEFSMSTIDEMTDELDMNLLEELELDKEFIESISRKVYASKSKDNQMKLRNDLTEFFDKLMKCIQNSIRTGQIKIDEVLRPKLESLLAVEIPQDGFTETLNSFAQILKNKSNIIITIHKNELNSKSNQVADNVKLIPNFYLALLICKHLLIGDDDRIRELKSFIDKNITSSFFDTLLDRIFEAGEIIKTSESELSLLFWLSQIMGNMEDDHKNVIMSKLGLDSGSLKSKFPHQQALIVNLIPDSDKLTSPIQEISKISKVREMLPHFTPL